jgi:hypothetical protein
MAAHPAEDANSLGGRHVAVPGEAFMLLVRLQGKDGRGRGRTEDFARTLGKAGVVEGMRRVFISGQGGDEDATDATELVGMRRGKRPWIVLGRDSLDACMQPARV